MNHKKLLKGSIPLNLIVSLFSSSILSSWLYLLILSLLESEPVLICPAEIATDKSAIKLSSVSPDLWEIIVLKLFCFPNVIDSMVSVNVPIWFNLISIEFPHFFLIFFFIISGFVTNK